ncbi:hypothetical protein FSP39_001486 [Pinctada imbricata]|uniref:G-protein coupled receptors family 1 profile domain-containing protein n=1 Tax=Pinctada imbricata TaxID=66713 RepID=A0AA89C6B1_PINIB|nr:hypothetical protein FSP39_001486 [Pinctada imbricata]
MDTSTEYFVNISLDNTTLSPVPSSRAGFPPLLVAFISLQQTVFVISFIGNTFVVVIFSMYIKGSITNKFIINLAINDLFTGLSSGSQIFYFLYRDLTKNMYSCFLRYQVVSVMTFASQFNMTFITADRFIAICGGPTLYQKLMTKRTSNIMIALAWVIPLLVCSLPFMGFNKWDLKPRCSFAYIFEEWYYLVPSTTIYTLMLATLLMYALILRKAFTLLRRSLDNTKETNVERREALQQSIRSAKVTATITIVFILCWAPYELYQFKYGLGDPRDLANFDLSSWLVFLGIANSMMNPFIYAWQKSDFRKNLASILCPYRMEQIIRGSDVKRHVNDESCRRIKTTN